jgi:hypothetical protein
MPKPVTPQPTIARPPEPGERKAQRKAGVWNLKGSAKSTFWIASDFDAPLPSDLLVQFIGSRQ